MAIATTTPFASMHRGGDHPRFFVRMVRTTIAALSALAIVFAAVLVAAPMAGASPVQILSVSGTVDATSSTTIDAVAGLEGTDWATLTNPSLTLVAIDSATLTNGVAPTQPPNTTSSCTATFSPGSSWSNFAPNIYQYMRCDITGLIENHSYYIYAVGADGATQVTVSHSITTVTPGIAPAAPTNVVLTPGNGQLTVAATVGDLGSGTYFYTSVSVYSNFGISPIFNGSCIDTEKGVTAGATVSCTVMNLPAASANTYAVSLTLYTNVAGAPPVQVTTTPAINAASVPDAPTVLAAEPSASGSSSSMAVIVEAPADLGGSVVETTTCTAHDVADGANTANDVTTTGYATSDQVATQSTCMFSSTALTNQPFWNFGTRTSGSHTIPAAGLQVGHTYTFTATITNATGTSVSSAASSFSQILAGGPSAVTNLTTTGGTGDLGGLAVSWTAASTNGAAVTGYTASVSSEGSIGAHCVIPSGQYLTATAYDGADNEYYVTNTSGQSSTFQLNYCTAAGVLKTMTMAGVGIFGGLTSPSISGTTATFYAANSIGGTWELDSYSFDTSAASPSLSRTTLFTTTNTAAFTGRILRSNATHTAFYSVGFCMSSCADQVFSWNPNSGSGTPPVVTPKVIKSYPMATLPSQAAVYDMAVDSNGTLWVSSGVSSYGLSGLTFSGGVLDGYTASSVAAQGASELTPDVSFSVAPTLGVYDTLAAGPSGSLYAGSIAAVGSQTSGNSVVSVNTSTGATTSFAGVGGPSSYRAPTQGVGLAYDANGNLVAGYESGSQAGNWVAAYVIPVASQPPGGSCVGQLISGTTWGCTITGLWSTLYYSVFVQAVASYPSWVFTITNGQQVWSQGTRVAYSTASMAATAYAVPPASPPPAVTGVTAAQSNAGVVVNWTPGTDPNKPNASTYTANAYLGTSTTAASQYCTVAAPATTCTITGLSAGTYTIKVLAQNTYTASHAGTALPTSAAGTVSVTTPPGAATGVTATAIGNGANVSWTAPTDLGGATAGSVTYAVTAIPAGQGSAGTCTWTSGTTATCTGLSTSDSYTFRVVASTSAGSGPGATSSTPVTPLAPPGTPTAPTLTVGSGGLLVKASSTQTTGLTTGNQTLTYTASVVNPQSVAVGSCTYTDPSIGCAVTGLVNGTIYTVTVLATNSAGISGSPSASTTAMPAGAPGAPTALAVSVPASTQGTVANLSWSAPSFTGGDGVAITGYDITATPSGGSCSVTTSDVTLSSLQGTCTGLTNGTAYTFSVIAKNGSGGNIQASAGSNAATATVASLPTAPTGVQGTGGDVSVAVKWTAPTNTGGAGVAITGYSVQAYQGGNAVQGSTCTTTGATTCTVFGLTNGTAYTFTVTATNLIGTGTASTASSAVSAVPPPSAAPAQPSATATLSTDKKSVTVTFNGGTALCTAGAMCKTGGKTYAVTGYVVTSQPAGATCTTKSAVTATSQSYSCTGVAGQAYTFKVAATNKPASGTVPSNVGQGPYSGPTSSVTPQGVPVTPTNVSISALNGNMTISFNLDTTSSVQTGGSTITGFTVTATDPTGGVSPATCNPTVSSGSSFSCQLTGLSTQTAYTVTVTATNALGTSVAAQVTNITPALNFMSLASMGQLGFTIAVGGNGSISRSLNGGNTWAASPDVASTLSNLNSVSCTKTVCVAVGDGGTILVWAVAITKSVHATGAPTYTASSKSVTIKTTNSLVVGQRVWVDAAPATQYVVSAASPTQFTVVGMSSTTPISADPKWTTTTSFDWVTVGPQTWTSVPVQGVSDNLSSVSCNGYDTANTSVACFIGGAKGRLLAMNWSQTAPTTLTQANISVTGTAYDSTASVNAINCSTTSSGSTICIVAGGNGQVGVLTRPSSASGSPSLAMLSVTGLSGKAINGVRCLTTTAGATYCIGVGQSGLILTNGKSATPSLTAASSWQVVAGKESTYDLNGIACMDSNRCIVVGAHGTVEVSSTTGSTLPGNTSASWQLVTSGLSYDLNSVRCLATQCIASGVGHLVSITPPASGSTTWKVSSIG